jgi:hypothetical protein
LNIQGTGANIQAVRLVNTDANGGFRADGLPPGEYRIEAGSRRYFVTEYIVILEPGVAEEAPLELPIRPAPESVPPVGAVVNSVLLPDYPREARLAGGEGAVRLRLSMTGDAVGDVNVESTNPLLGRLAAENARTWRFAFTTAPLIVINYRYRLLGGDCTPDQRPSITMRLPYAAEKEVEIVAKRIVPCEPFRDALFVHR